MMKKEILVASLLILLFSQACAGQNDNEEPTLEDIWYKLSLIDTKLSLLENQINSIIDLLNSSVSSQEISVYLILPSSRGFSVKQVTQGIENVLSLKIGTAILQVKQPDGTPSSGIVRLTPPISDNFFLSFFGGQFSYAINLSNGMAMLNLFTEGLWMVSIEETGYPPFTFFLKVEKEEQSLVEQVFLSIIGTFSKGKLCVIKATDQYGKTVDGTIRILDTGNPLGVIEGPNPMPYTPKSNSISVSFLREGKEVASRTFSETSSVKKSREIPVIWIAVAIACLSLFLLAWKMEWFKKIPIPR